MIFKVGDIINTGGGDRATITRIANFDQKGSGERITELTYLLHDKGVGNFWMSYDLVYKHNIELIIENRNNKINEILNKNIVG